MSTIVTHGRVVLLLSLCTTCKIVGGTSSGSLLTTIQPALSAAAAAASAGRVITEQLRGSRSVFNSGKTFYECLQFMFSLCIIYLERLLFH